MFCVCMERFIFVKMIKNCKLIETQNGYIVILKCQGRTLFFIAKIAKYSRCAACLTLKDYKDMDPSLTDQILAQILK